MVRGRPPHPRQLKALHGEKRPSRLPVEAQPAERRPEPPKWLSAEALEVWDRTVVELAAMGLAFSADQDLLAAYASSVAMFIEAERVLATEGRIYVDANGQHRRNPWLFVRRDALDVMTRVGGSFGLSPSARVHLPSTSKRSPEDELADRLLS